MKSTLVVEPLFLYRRCLEQVTRITLLPRVAATRSLRSGAPPTRSAPKTSRRGYMGICLTDNALVSFLAACTISVILTVVPSQAGPVLEGNLGDIAAKAIVDRDSVALSKEIVLSLTVEGPARLEVIPPLAMDAIPPRRLLTEASLQWWSISDNGLWPVEILDNGRQRWRQDFILRPFKAGPAIEIALAPLKVKAGNALEVELNWRDKVTIPVTTSIRSADLQQLRTITDVEVAGCEPGEPVRPETLVTRSRGCAWGHPDASNRCDIGATRRQARTDVVLRRRLGTERIGSAHSKSGVGGAAAFARISEVLRQFLEHRFDMRATRLTTAEMIEQLRQKNAFTAADESELLEILTFCDLTKFAGTFADHSGPADVSEWCGLAIGFVNKTKPAEPVNSVQSTIS